MEFCLKVKHNGLSGGVTLLRQRSNIAHPICPGPADSRMSRQTIKTPCIGLCSTVYGDLVCRGCKRFDHEIVNWNLYDEQEKRAVWRRLELLLAQVMTAKLEVFDACRLREQLDQRKIRYVPEQSEYCWAYQLIARGARLIQQLDAYGMSLLPEFRDWSLPQLRDAIDREFFLLSEAHYERYIAPRFLLEGLDTRV